MSGEEIEELVATTDSAQQSRQRALLGRIIVPVLAIVTSLVVSSSAMLLSGTNPLQAYSALAEGAFGSRDAIIETLIKAAPYVLAGLGIALAFRGGLFNIGIQGQLFMGSVFAVVAGYSVELPAIVHIPFALLVGMIGGALWGAIPGYLKARQGAHEVITTIMMNYIASRIISWALTSSGPLRAPRTVVPETRAVFESARLPMLIPESRLHAGVIVALLAAVVVFWLLWRTVLGFEIRTVGANPSAARYAGINVEGTIILTMTISGALAGLGGAIQVMGLAPFNFTTGFNVGLGFDSIAVAVLGGIHPFGVTLSAFLFGAMDAGSRLMQLRTKVPIDIVTIVQGLILMFVAADQIVRNIFRIRAETEEGPVRLSDLWGGET
jgi:ABC-type uncharacterized transport system permease subunit